MEFFWDALLDALIDGVKLLPFLLITYLVMEYLEHKASAKSQKVIEKSGKFGPLIGSLLGIVPQCGFSAAASNLYAGRIITMGTLISIYLSTSDEMLPIFISEQVPASMILKILGIKVIIGMLTGFVIDFIYRRITHNKKEELRIEHMCDHEHCHCKEGHFVKSAIIHTLQVFGFILVISLILNIMIELIGENNISAFLANKAILSVFLSGIVGLIPNCAASVIITQLFLEGFLGFGAMIAGLLVGAGVGLLVLFRVNDDIKENLKITSVLYIVGVIFGIVISLLYM